MGCRDGVIKQRLAAHGFIAENTKGDAVTFRVWAPVLGQRRKHPAAAAHAGDGYDFALQVRRIFDFGDAMMLPMSLLIMPATNTRSFPPRRSRAQRR